MPKEYRVIPLLEQPSPVTKPRLRYDCAKCPAYCCSYQLIEVGKRDIARLARHFNVSYEQAERRYTKYDKAEKVRTLRHQPDQHFGQVCRFLDPKLRRCTIYEARPGVCRHYPDGNRCGYFDFLQFEREHQGDPEYVAVT